MSVSQLITSAFRASAGQFPEVWDNWNKASFGIVKYTPGRFVSVSVQQCGQLDILIRAIESEVIAIMNNPTDSGQDILSHQYNLSALWVGNAYELCRLVKEAGLLKSDQFDRLAHHLRLIRVPLEKMQIALDSKIKEPLELVSTHKELGNDTIYKYDKRDPNRSHIMPFGVNYRGSLSWQVIDTNVMEAYWLERQYLADEFLKVFS